VVSAFPPVGAIIFGLVYLLFMLGMAAIAVFSVLALWRISKAHESLAQNFKELVRKLTRLASRLPRAVRWKYRLETTSLCPERCHVRRPPYH